MQDGNGALNELRAGAARVISFGSSAIEKAMIGLLSAYLTFVAMAELQVFFGANERERKDQNGALQE